MLRRSSIAAGAWLLNKYLVYSVRSQSTEWYASRDGSLIRNRSEMIPPHLEELSHRRPLLFLFWNAHSLLILSAYLANSSLRGPLCNLQAVADDSAGGKLTQSLFRRAGLRLRLLRHDVPAERLLDLAGILTDRPDIAIAIDSHGPYRSVGVPIARLARSLKATVVPLSAAATRSVRVFRKIEMSIPLPTSLLKVGIGTPIDCQSLTLVEIKQQIACSLESLETQLLEDAQ